MRRWGFHPRARDRFSDGAFGLRPNRGNRSAPFLRSKPSTETKVTFSLEQRDYRGDQLSSSSPDALRLPVETSNVPIHLQAGDPLYIAGLVDRRVYAFLLVGNVIFRPVINDRLPGILFLSQTAANGGAAVWAKDSAKIFFGPLAGLPNVYSRHTPGPHTSFGGLLLRLRLGGVCIELLVTLDIGRQIGRPGLPVSNRRLHARVRRLQRRGGVLAYGYASRRQEGRGDYAHTKSKTAQPAGRGANPTHALSLWIPPAVRPPILRACFGYSCHG